MSLLYFPPLGVASSHNVFYRKLQIHTLQDYEVRRLRHVILTSDIACNEEARHSAIEREGS